MSSTSEQSVSSSGSPWQNTEVFTSYAQNWEDVVLHRVLGHIEGGTYVDVGAADPVHDSVTKAFYDRGWSGLNVEPVGEYFDRLVSQRPRDESVRVGAGAERSTAVLYRVVGTGMSTVVDEVAGRLAAEPWDVVEESIEIVPLDQIFVDAAFHDRTIHFLKIDVEGFEDDVLAGIDLSVHRPWVIVVEATEPNSQLPAHAQWEVRVREADYGFALFDGLNRFYVAAEHPDIARALSYPVCVFDHPYISAGQHALDEELESVRSEAARQIDELHGRYSDVVDALHVKQQTIEAASKELIDKQQMLEDLRAQVVAKQQMLADVVESASAISAERDELQHSLVTQAAELDELRAKLHDVEESTSWKVTKPLRSFGHIAGRR